MQPLQLGILGVSNFYRKRIAIPIPTSPLIDIVAIASRSEAKAEAAAREYDIDRFYGSYEALLADDTIEAVYIPLPNHVHAEWIKRAADAGKHVLCEKPLALDAAEAQDCLQYASEKGITVMEAFMYRLHPQWQHIRQIIRQREIGSVQLIEVFFGFSNADPNNIRNQPATGGGALLDIGCYAVSGSRFLIGSEPSKVISLVQTDAQFGTDTLFSGLLDFGSARASFTVGTQTFPYQRVVVHGSSGIITLMIPFNAHADVEAHVAVTTSVGTRDLYIPPEDQYIIEFEAFAQAVKSQQAVPISSAETIRNLRVLDALRKSHDTGKWEAVEEFNS